MKKSFQFDFEDEGDNSVSYEVEPGASIACDIQNGVPVVFVDKNAARVLATVFAQLSIGSVSPGYHIHLGQDFEESPEALRIVLTPPARH